MVFWGKVEGSRISSGGVCGPGHPARMLSFFANLPLCLERNDLRVVHASWQDEAVASLGGATSAISLFEDFRQRIETQIHDRRKIGSRILRKRRSFATKISTR